MHVTKYPKTRDMTMHVYGSLNKMKENISTT